MAVVLFCRCGSDRVDIKLWNTFIDLPNSRTSHWGAGVTPEQMKEMRWLKPKLVAQIRFVEWTGDGHLRHAAFLGLRTDKKASDISRER